MVHQRLRQPPVLGDRGPGKISPLQQWRLGESGFDLGPVGAILALRHVLEHNQSAALKPLPLPVAGIRVGADLVQR